MCTRGVYQLKNIKLFFCDWGGSSKGTREFLNSDFLKEFMTKNNQISLEFILRRGSHPYISSSYINGYKKDQSLKNLDPEEIIDEFQRARNSFGRKHLPHAGKKVISTVKSIQGGWKPNMWENYPQHELEVLKIIPAFEEKFELSENRKFTNPQARNQEDPINKLFKERSWLDDT